MTESYSCITAHPAHRYDWRYAHTVGSVVAGTEVRIVRPDGSDVDAFDEPGEILARGPQVATPGYLDDERATRETFDAEGWLHTGDQGAIDADGMVTITDRIKEMIKVKGVAVAPAELEDLLLGHAKVQDVAVLGVPDEYAGEVPKAYIVPKSGVVVGKKGEEKQATAMVALGRELLAYVRENRVRYKRVREIEFIDEIPKSASGKIPRRVLRDRAKGTAEKGVVVREAEMVEKAML